MTARWWEALPEGTSHLSNATAASFQHPLKVLTTAAVDRVAASSLGMLISVSSLPRLMTRRRFDAELAQLDFYRELADLADASKSFVKPPSVSVRERPFRRGDYAPKGVSCRQLAFESPFQPLNPSLKASYLRHANNRTATALHYFHEDKPRPALIFLHGFCAPWYGLNSRWFHLPWFYRKGYEILLVQLPFHGARREVGHPFNGFGFVANGFAHINEAIFQAVSDVRSWLDYLLARGTPSVGVSGLSLGGYVTSAVAAADDRLAFAIPNSPVVSLFDMAREWVPSGAILDFALRRSGIRISQMRHGVAAHSPLTYPAQITPERQLIIGGAGDRFTSPRFVRMLHEHWRGSTLHWFPGNHILHLQQGNYLRLMKRFMDRNTAV